MTVLNVRIKTMNHIKLLRELENELISQAEGAAERGNQETSLILYHQAIGVSKARIALEVHNLNFNPNQAGTYPAVQDDN